MTLRRDASPIGISSQLLPAHSEQKRVLFIFGTRPEAIKLCPLVTAFQKQKSRLNPLVCVTGQHNEMLHQVLKALNVKPDFDLRVMTQGQGLNHLSSRLLAGLDDVLEQTTPSLTIVQGDTTSTLCGALASFHRRIPVAHVEAGLRTYDLSSPFPEESNRVLTDRLSQLHFAATQWAADNLLREGFSSQTVSVTGNTGIDSVLSVNELLQNGRLKPRSFPLDLSKRLILVTTHRRESFGQVLAEICGAIATLSNRADVQVIWPVHPNPQVKSIVGEAMQSKSNVILTEPLDYVSFVDLMRRSHFILTDSGGIQEEAPSLGKPVLVLREKTERPEALASGTVRLAGVKREDILREAEALLNDPDHYARMAQRSNPYGDGNASARITAAVTAYLFRRVTN